MQRQKRNILIVTENSHRGGLDSFITTLINNWPDDLDIITLYCNRSHPGLFPIERNLRRKAKVIAHDLPLQWSSKDADRSRLTRILQAPFRLLGRIYLFLHYILHFIKFYQNIGCDRLLVVNGGYPAGLTCRAATVAWGLTGRKPLGIHNFHNFAQLPRWYEMPMELVIDRLVHRYSKSLISVSETCATSLRSRSAFKNSKKISFVHNGIDYVQPQTLPAVTRSEFNIENAAPLLIMLGTYEPRKGARYLFDALPVVIKALPNTRLLLCGFGYPHEVRQMEMLLDELQLHEHVTLLSFQENVSDLIAASTLLLLPSQSLESFGLTIVEAMSLNVPVIATRIGGIPEVLKDGHGGYLVAPDDPIELAQRIIEISQDDSLQESLGRMGRKRFEQHFTSAKMAEAYAALL